MKFEGITITRTDDTGFRIVKGPGPHGRYLSTNDDEDNAITYISNELYDAIPRVDISLEGLMDPEDLWDLLDFDNDDLRKRWILEDGEITTVYFVISPDTGMIKIGYTASFERRMSVYVGHNCGDLGIYKVPGNRAMERALLQRFRPVRRRGEWHYPHPALIAYIQAAI
jgi:hypothetical protein